MTFVKTFTNLLIQLFSLHNHTQPLTTLLNAFERLVFPTA